MIQETYRLKVVRLDGGEIEVIGNRAGLKDLAGVCQVCSTSTHGTVFLLKRVFLKSPVRENRTPGSVPGLSGNR